MPLTRTHTRTYALLNAWAETYPWDCLIRPTQCISPDHQHNPMADQLCAVGDCQKPLLADEVCYAVTELDRLPDGREPWVCWRHVRPDDGPIRLARNTQG